jgi:hypothetical protein
VRWLRFNGYVAFNTPRAVTTLGAVLLMGVAAEHGCVVATGSRLPSYFTIYCAVVIASCVASIAAMGSAGRLWLPQLGWWLGSGVCVLVSELYLVSRVVSWPSLAVLTGRWDLAAGTVALACAAGFVAVHLSVLFGINVAYPHDQQWRD